jgi:hypothetical protein
MEHTTAALDQQQEHTEAKLRLVEVKIDGTAKEIPADTYQVSALKTLLGVPIDYDLELVKGGKFHPLNDAEPYKVHGHEEFISHVPCGGSS